MNPTCPPDDQLLALASDEPNSLDVREHVEHCAECQTRVKLLCTEIAEWRSLSASKIAAKNTTIVFGSASPPISNTTLIGRYVVVATLGAGGQADVYLVVDPNLGRQLVLKLSRRQVSIEDERRNALLAEGRVLASLDHPGLVRVFDVGIFGGLREG